jgi:glycosyltransferase involved in cell wall biosynthesis
MKLLIFCPYYPPHIGGLESHADEFNRYLSLEDVDIIVFTPRLPKNSPKEETRHNNVRIIRFPAFEIIHNYPLPKFWSFEFWHLFLNLFKQKFDIVISRTRFFNTSLLALIYAKIKSVRWIHIEHGSDFVKSGGNFTTSVAKIYDYTFGKLILKKADKIIANSKASSVFCNKIAKNISCNVIYRGVEEEEIASILPDLELKNKYGGSVIITFLGRLFDGKGVSDLLSALSRIQNKNYVCFIIGDGPEKKNLENLAAKLNIREKIIFFGYKNFEDYIKILKISDIFINPSYTEGLPTTVIEAALCKNAIIATNVGGTPEIIIDKKSGFLIEPKNIGQLEERIKMLITNKNLRETIGKNASDEVKNKFNWPSSIKKYLTIFEIKCSTTSRKK